MFMSAVWETIFYMRDRHPQAETFLIGGKIPAMAYGEGERPTVILAGFNGNERASAIVALKYFDKFLSALESGESLSGIKINKAMRGRRIIVVPCVSPKAVNTDGILKSENYRAIKKYLLFHRTGKIFALREGEASVVRYGRAVSDEEKTADKIIAACSGLSFKIAEQASPVGGKEFYSLCVQGITYSSVGRALRQFEETLTVGALL